MIISSQAFQAPDRSVPQAMKDDEINLALPELNQEKDVEVKPLADGKVMLGGEKMTMEELGKRVKKLVKEDKDLQIRLIADGKIEYKKVVAILDQLKASGVWNISFRKNSTEVAPRKFSPPVIEVDKNGGIKINKKVLSVGELKAKLVALARVNTTQKVIISPSAGALNKDVLKLISVCIEAGMEDVRIASPRVLELENKKTLKESIK